MPDITDSARERLSSVFAAHNGRLVRALRARLGRYNWHLAEDLAATTWLRAVENADDCPAEPRPQFAWLRGLAEAVAGAYLRQTRHEVATDFSSARAYTLPVYEPVDDIALALIEDLADEVAPVAAGVAL